jgi:hypothetical protein
MSITPIEEDGREKERTPAEDQRPGVRARLCSWVASVRDRLRGAFSPGPSTREVTAQRPDEQRAGEIRVGGQRRLAGAPQEPATDRETPPSARRALPARSQVSAERDGDRFRVYNPQLDDAFISSDTWEVIEQ